MQINLYAKIKVDVLADAGYEPYSFDKTDNQQDYIMKY